MQVVGVDFGTTNIRISTWDSEQNESPRPRDIGTGPIETAMPAVVALRRQPGGEVEVIIGEEADSLRDVPNQIEVIRNIKRYALSGDSYVNWHLEVRNAQEESPGWPKSSWNSAEGSFRVWDGTFPVWDLIQHILAEALRRAGIEGEYEWRAGCPVHANLEYRKELASALSRLTGKGNVHWIAEEPVLFLTLARRLGDLTEGSYLVYDFGGGSFDCALVEVQGDEMLVYGADGHPLLGGSDIDEGLEKRLDYDGQPDLFRQAKERLNVNNTSETLADGTVLTITDLEYVLRNHKFVPKSLSTLRDAYVGGKTLWKRGGGEDDPPVGEVINRDSQSGAVRFVWQLMWDDIVGDVDKIILVGGPTRSEHFYQELSKRLGADKIVTASEMLPTLQETPDLELVSISMGACYSYDGIGANQQATPLGSLVPMYANRLPASVTLENLETGDKVEYNAFDNLAPNSEPFGEFVSAALPAQPALVRSDRYPNTIEMTIVYPNGLVERRAPIDERIDERLIGYTLRLVIDRFGRVGVEQASEKTDPKGFVIWTDTPWQTEGQRKALQRLFEQQERYEQEQRRRGYANINRLPWNYPTP